MIAVASGESHSCGLAESGEAYCWGDGSSGQLGTGNTGSERYAVPIAADRGFTALTAGGDQTCALTSDAVAWCWGSNSSGQLGIGAADMVTSPREVETELRFLELSAGLRHTCGITVGGRAYCWGDGTDGKLGTGSPVANTSSPQAVATDLVFTRISAGARHTCGIVEGGEMYCWGANELAQLGTGAEGPAELAPARVDSNVPFADVSAGYNHSCAASVSGTAYCWGENRHGEIGNTTRHQPDLPAERRPAPVTTFGPIFWTQVTAGRFYSCGLRINAELMCWGRGANGQLGNSEMSDHTLPQLVELEPGRLFQPGNGTFASMDAGATHTCATTIDGLALCWGEGAEGQLGSGEYLTMVPYPVRLGAW
ncbi:MAG: RCC1 domain-containing protein [Longimicrobiales bacterium]